MAQGGGFTGEGRRQARAGALKAAWWGLAGLAARRLVRRREGEPPVSPATSEPAPRGFARAQWLEAFEKDRRDVEQGLYPAMDDMLANPAEAVRAAIDMLTDAREVDARRRRRGGVEARDDAPEGGAYPAYYRQNFHFQSGGWFTAASARRYEAQVETLFAGAAGAMRRRALSLLARAWRARDQRQLMVADIACGSGGFLRDLARTFPRAGLIGVDLSAAYAREAAERSGVATIQAKAERLPFADASLDAAACVYLFHELPAAVRKAVAVEIARVLKPGGLLAFADSVQPSEEPRLARLLEVFPAYFHEPYFADYGRTDLTAVFADAGFVERGRDRAFLTSAMLLEKS